MGWVQYVTTLLAVVGTVLGVINFWRAIRDDKVRLRVSPLLAWRKEHGYLLAERGGNFEGLIAEHGEPEFALQVINLSKFTVQITDAGICEGKRDIERARAPMRNMRDMRGKAEIPFSLLSRTDVTILCNSDHLHEYRFTTSSEAYVRTSCGVTVFATTPAFDWWKSQRLARLQH